MKLILIIILIKGYYNYYIMSKVGKLDLVLVFCLYVG